MSAVSARNSLGCGFPKDTQRETGRVEEVGNSWRSKQKQATALGFFLRSSVAAAVQVLLHGFTPLDENGECTTQCRNMPAFVVVKTGPQQQGTMLSAVLLAASHLAGLALANWASQAQQLPTFAGT